MGTTKRLTKKANRKVDDSLEERISPKERARRFRLNRKRRKALSAEDGILDEDELDDEDLDTDDDVQDDEDAEEESAPSDSSSFAKYIDEEKDDDKKTKEKIRKEYLSLSLKRLNRYARYASRSTDENLILRDKLKREIEDLEEELKNTKAKRRAPEEEKERVRNRREELRTKIKELEDKETIAFGKAVALEEASDEYSFIYSVIQDIDPPVDYRKTPRINEVYLFDKDYLLGILRDKANGEKEIEKKKESKSALSKEPNAKTIHTPKEEPKRVGDSQQKGKEAKKPSTGIEKEETAEEKAEVRVIDSSKDREEKPKEKKSKAKAVVSAILSILVLLIVAASLFYTFTYKGDSAVDVDSGTAIEAAAPAEGTES